MSNIEIVYDQNVAAEKLKSGTKYERLTAIVYKILEANNVVIHDLRLKGDGKTASHQIDVTVQKGSTKKKVLVECKNYDSKIGIGIVRDFFGAVNQIKPDEAYVVTTVGFTKGAVDFASDEGIKLHILRSILKSDLNGRLLKINRLTT
jgi:predicted helicase